MSTILERILQYYPITATMKAIVSHRNHKDKEFFLDHSNLVIDYQKYLLKELNLQIIFNNLFDSYEQQLFIVALFVHDIGKFNPYYQEKLTINSTITPNSSSSKHSIFSAYVFLVLTFNQLLSDKKNNLFHNSKFNLYLMDILVFGYLISRHHTNLTDLTVDFFDELKNQKYCNWFSDFLDLLTIDRIDKINSTNHSCLDYLRSTFQKMNNIVANPLDSYIKQKFAYSLLLTCDFAATYEYMHGKPFKVATPLDPTSYFYGSLYKDMLWHKNAKIPYSDPINNLRSQMAWEAVSNALKSDSMILQLEEPCGGGKTNTSLLCACTLLKHDSSFRGMTYTSPFNTITDQNTETFHEYFPEMQAITSTSTTFLTKDSLLNTEKFVMDYELNNFGFISTSHVHLFNTLFGVSREQCINLLFQTNRIIILDEIQAYTPHIWKYMIEFLKRYSELLHIKFIFMSATLPDLSLLSETNDGITALLPNKREYFSHPLFKNRVDFSYIGQINSFDPIIKEEKFYKGKKVLYEFITKTTAKAFYNVMKKRYPELLIFYLDGDDSIINRKKIINEAKLDIVTQIIIVSTQVIEAGVDLDFNFGFKDSSLPDSEIQFLGRINRSCKRHKEFAIFFSYDIPFMYHNDPRLASCIWNQEIQNAIHSCDTSIIYKLTLTILKRNAALPSFPTNYEDFLGACSFDQFKTIYKSMQLIDSTACLYLAHAIIISQADFITCYSTDFFNFVKHLNFPCVQLDSLGNIILNGSLLWTQLQELGKQHLAFDDYFIIKKALRILSANFTYTIFPSQIAKLTCVQEIITNHMYYSDNEDLLSDGKLIRE